MAAPIPIPALKPIAVLLPNLLNSITLVVIPFAQYREDPSITAHLLDILNVGILESGCMMESAVDPLNGGGSIDRDRGRRGSVTVTVIVIAIVVVIVIVIVIGIVIGPTIREDEADVGRSSGSPALQRDWSTHD